MPVCDCHRNVNISKSEAKSEAQILQLAFIMIRNFVKLSRPRIDGRVELEHSNVSSDAAKLGLATCKQVRFRLFPSDLVVG